MSADNPAGRQLFDFLYRDPSRVASFSAQLFGGLLTGVELSGGTKKSSETGGGFSAVIKGDHKRGKEATKGGKETFVPHDVSATNVLTRLGELGYVHADARTAPHGAIVEAEGFLEFGDATLLTMLADVMGDQLVKGPAAGKRAEGPTAKQLRDMLKSIRLPSVLSLTGSDGLRVVATVKEGGLDEPIGAYYFKHGESPIPNVRVLGIKEVGVKPDVRVFDPPHVLTRMTHLVANAFGEVLFPPDAIRVAPILIYRVVTPAASQPGETPLL